MGTRNRRGRGAIAVVVILTLVATACSSSSARWDEESTREAAAPAVAGQLVRGATAALTALESCLADRERSQPCQASDLANIRATLADVRTLRAGMAADQQQALGELDSIRGLIRNPGVRQATEGLRPMVTNLDLAVRAYEALAECASSSLGTCKPYTGRSDDPAEDAVTAIPTIRRYFLAKAAELPRDLAAAVSWFTGSAPGFDDGLATAIWLFNKRAQDTAAGVTAAAVKASDTVPVITPELATAQNQDNRYWSDTFSEYGFLTVLSAGMSGGSAAASRRQAEADASIAAPTPRSSVSGTAAHYALPEINGFNVVLADAGKAWLLSEAPIRAGRALTPTDLVDLGRIIGTYAPLESFSKIPRAMPVDGWYTVKTPIQRARYPRLELIGSEREYGQEIRLGTWTNLDVNWLADTASATDSCSSRVRPVSSPPEFSPNEVRLRADYPKASDRGGYERFVRPSFTPETRLRNTWDRFAAGRPIEFSWAPVSTTAPMDVNGKRVNGTLGWGAWVECQFGRPQGTVVELLRVPGVM